MAVVHSIQRPETEKQLVARGNEEYSRAVRAHHRAHGEIFLNVAMYMGDQWTGLNRRTNELYDTPNALIPKWRIRATRNYIKPTVKIYVANATGNAPAWNVKPGSTDEEDRNAARMSGHALEYVAHRVKLQLQLKYAAKWSAYSGTGFLLPYFDPEADFFGLDVPSSLDIYLNEGATSVDRAFRVIRAHEFQIEEARRRWPDHDLQPDRGVEQDPYTARLARELSGHMTWDQGRKDRIIIIEKWERRTKDYDQGLYVVQTKDQLLNEIGTPLVDNDIPLIGMTLDAVPGRPLGDPFITSLREPQMQVNRIRSGLIEALNLHGMPKWLVSRLARVEKDCITPEPGEVIKWSGVGPQPTQMTPPPMPSHIFRLMEQEKEDIEFMANVFEASRGERPAGVRSGRQMAYMQQAANRALAEYMESQVAGLERLGGTFLKLWQVFIDEPRAIHYMGSDGRMEISDFYASDIRSNDVRIEVGQMMPTNRALVEDSIREDFKLGIVDKPEARRMLERGEDWSTMYSNRDTERARWESKQLLAGIAVPVFAHEDHRAHWDQHRLDMTGDEFYSLSPEAQRVPLLHMSQHETYLAREQQAPRGDAKRPEQPTGMGGGSPELNGAGGPTAGVDQQEETQSGMMG